jgi:hypothetical protein
LSVFEFEPNLVRKDGELVVPIVFISFCPEAATEIANIESVGPGQDNWLDSETQKDCRWQFHES